MPLIPRYVLVKNTIAIDENLIFLPNYHRGGQKYGSQSKLNSLFLDLHYTATLNIALNLKITFKKRSSYDAERSNDGGAKEGRNRINGNRIQDKAGIRARSLEAREQCPYRIGKITRDQQVSLIFINS